MPRLDLGISQRNLTGGLQPENAKTNGSRIHRDDVTQSTAALEILEASGSKDRAGV
jgi:hypothetical protein